MDEVREITDVSRVLSFDCRIALTVLTRLADGVPGGVAMRGATGAGVLVALLVGVLTCWAKGVPRSTGAVKVVGAGGKFMSLMVVVTASLTGGTWVIIEGRTIVGAGSTIAVWLVMLLAC